jgi:hypothetical protein
MKPGNLEPVNPRTPGNLGTCMICYCYSLVTGIRSMPKAISYLRTALSRELKASKFFAEIIV